MAKWGGTNNKGKHKYSDEQLAEMKARSDRGESAGMIAKVMGLPSRNTVIGQLHRHFPESVKKTRAGNLVPRVKAQPSQPKPRPLPAPPPPSEPDTALSVPLAQASALHCRFPLWGENDGWARSFPVCGAATRFGVPYCDFHARKCGSAYQPKAAA